LAFKGYLFLLVENQYSKAVFWSIFEVFRLPLIKKKNTLTDGFFFMLYSINP